MSFPSDIKSAMRDCILKIFWPKRDIASFFQDNGCTSSDMKCLGDYKEISRARMIDTMFQHLSSRADGGLGPYRAMLQALATWSHFDPYYFDKLKKLNREDAQRAIEHLRQLEEIRDHEIKRKREERFRHEQISRQAKSSREALRDEYISLLQGSLPPQKRGYALEQILQELAKLSNLEVTEPFRILGEQIDGAVKFDGEHYLIEAKWQDAAASNEPVYQLAGKVEGKFYGRGIFISVNGYSPLVVESLAKGKALKTVLIDGADVMLVLEGFLSFADLLDRKVKSAQTSGLIYVDPQTGKSKT